MSTEADNVAQSDSSEGANPADGLTFWDHLDELRARLLRCLALTAVLGVVAFALKEPLFDIVLAPRSSDFLTYRLLGVEPFVVGLMNTGLTEQFMIHLKVALYAGLLVASPYVLYQIFAFVSPALYANERRYATQIVGSAYVMFAVGTLLNYLLIFPLTVRFLGTYQVSPDVANMLTLQSYTDTLITMSLLLGLVFELPVVCWILGRMGVLKRSFMREYRRHAVVVILVIAAIITPTTDAFTLSIVALPIWLLYELSILLVREN
jgi:sec-independent protein translocase protein TatC